MANCYEKTRAHQFGSFSFKSDYTQSAEKTACPIEIKMARLRKGFSQRQLSKILEVRPSVIAQLETDRCQVSRNVAWDISDVLEADISVLFPGLKDVDRSPFYKSTARENLKKFIESGEYPSGEFHKKRVIKYPERNDRNLLK